MIPNPNQCRYLGELDLRLKAGICSEKYTKAMLLGVWCNGWFAFHFL